MVFQISHAAQRQIITTLREVGRYQMQMRGTNLDARDKADHSPVTAVDLRSHQIITSALRALTPEIRILSEESSTLTDFVISEVETFWCIDPLDGTRDYIEGSDHFAINVALFHRGRVQWGVILHPATQEILIADRQIQRVEIIDAQGHAQALELPMYATQISTVLTSARVAMDANRQAQIKTFAPHLSGAAQIMPVSSSYKFFLLLQGHAQAYVRKAPCMIWDIAPGFLAAELAGMGILNLDTRVPFAWPQRALETIPPFAITMSRPLG